MYFTYVTFCTYALAKRTPDGESRLLAFVYSNTPDYANYAARLERYAQRLNARAAR